MALNKIRIESDAADTTIHVDDQEVKGLQAFTLSADIETRIPRLTMELIAGAEVEAVGLAEIIREPTHGEVMSVAAEWLDGVNPESVRALMESRAQTMRSDPVALIIKILADSAREVTD